MGSGPSVQWIHQRASWLIPAMLARFCAALFALTLLVAGVSFWQGAPLAAALAGLEMLVLALAFVMYTRHAEDRETLTLVDGSLHVEQSHGRRLSRTLLDAESLSVEPLAAQGSLVQLRGQGRQVSVGRHLRPESRAEFAQDLRRALRETPRRHAHPN